MSVPLMVPPHFGDAGPQSAEWPLAPGPALPGVLVGVLGQPHQVVHQCVRAIPRARQKLLGTDLLQDSQEVLSGALPD